MRVEVFLRAKPRRAHVLAGVPGKLRCVWDGPSRLFDAQFPPTPPQAGGVPRAFLQRVYKLCQPDGRWTGGLVGWHYRGLRPGDVVRLGGDLTYEFGQDPGVADWVHPAHVARDAGEL